MLIVALAGACRAADNLDRTVLPIHEPQPKTITTLDARDAKAPPRFEVKAPDGAPNVVIVLIDDIGFGHSSAFGGPINMPTLEKLASGGLKYNRFHTTALCSPTRVALLTGHNHHANNAGAIMELATAFPGNTGVRPRTITTLAEILRQNGYSTAAFGKYHETPPWEVSVSGPYDRWPTGSHEVPIRLRVVRGPERQVAAGRASQVHRARQALVRLADVLRGHVPRRPCADRTAPPSVTQSAASSEANCG